MARVQCVVWIQHTHIGLTGKLAEGMVKQKRGHAHSEADYDRLQNENARLRAQLSQLRNEPAPRAPLSHRSTPSTMHVQQGHSVSVPLRRGEGQITLKFEDAESSNANLSDNTSSVPVYNVRMQVLSDNASIFEWAENIASMGLQFLYEINHIQQHREDMVRIIIRHESLKNRSVSTRTISVHEAVSALVQAVENVLQSNDTFDINNAIEVDLQLQLNSPRGHTKTRFFRTEVEAYFRKMVLGNIDPLLIHSPGMCMIVSIVMSRCRQVDSESGCVVELPYLQLPEESSPWDLEDTMLCRKVDYQADIFSYYAPFVECCRLLWATVRQRYFASDPSVALTVNPSELQEKHCRWIAQFMKVCIHVLCFDAMGQEVMIYGDRRTHRHVYIFKQDCHYYPVFKVHCLSTSLNRTRFNWCDYCARHVGSDAKIGRNHIIKCCRIIREEGSTSLDKEFKKKWSVKNQSHFLPPPKNYERRRLFCGTCAKFVDETRGEELEEEEEEDVEDEDEDEQEDDEQENRSSFSLTCSTCSQRIMLLDYRICKFCRECVPLGSFARGHLRYQWINEHVCFCNPRSKEAKIGEASSYWVWDLECFTDQVAATNYCGVVPDVVVGEHKPIFVAACNMLDPSQRFSFEGEGCMDQFCKHVFETARFKNCTFLAHNSGGYDSQFVMRWIERHGHKPEIIPAPNSIFRAMQVKFGNVTFKDSWNFITIALSKFAKSFGLPQTKGDFPHKFSSRIHLTYEGCMPAFDDENDWYGLKLVKGCSITETERLRQKMKGELAQLSSEFWSESHPDRPKWVFMDQLKRYCWQDVEVLRMGCLKYREMFMEVREEDAVAAEVFGWRPVRIDPFQYLTQSQVLQIWFLLGGSFQIARIPYRVKNDQSRKALAWLLKMQQELRNDFEDRSLVIRHAYNGYREIIAEHGHYVDGYAEAHGIIFVYEFHGCYWHGCPECFDGREKHPHYGVRFEEVHALTLEKEQRLREAYERMGKRLCYIRLWEHDFDETLYEDYKQLADVMSDRDAFYGGHVNVFKPQLLANLDRGEHIRYIDITSHYPNICAHYELCTGHPQRLLGSEIDLSRFHKDHVDPYFGFFRGIIRPNVRDMYGGLPHRDRHGTVLFDNMERLISGFIPELQERLEHGAEIVEMMEVLHFDVHNRVKGPFRGYVAYNYRDKMEASGWSSMTHEHEEELTVERKQDICRRVSEENQGLCEPRWDFVENNPGRRFLSKLRINSLWGKYVQQDVHQERVFINSLKDYLTIVSSVHVRRDSILFRKIYKDLFEVRFEYNDDSYQRAHNINPYLAASVTGWARTLLHKKIRETDAAYCDTDSVVYLHDPEKHPGKWGDEGSGIGQWGDELEEGVKGKEFYALSPKCYCLVFDRADSSGNVYTLKSKGVTMTHTNHGVVNRDMYAELLRSAVMQEDDSLLPMAHTWQIILNHYYTNIGYLQVITQEGKKAIRCVFNKRELVVYENPGGMLLPSSAFRCIETVPFGWRDEQREFYKDVAKYVDEMVEEDLERFLGVENRV